MKDAIFLWDTMGPLILKVSKITLSRMLTVVNHRAGASLAYPRKAAKLVKVTDKDVFNVFMYSSIQ